MMVHPLLARFAGALVLVLLAGSAFAALPAGVTEGPSVEGITEYRLANGLKVVLFPDPSAATTSVNVTYLVGSRHENYGETGMAHLLEHMLFKGTPKIGDYRSEFTRRGMRTNGSTWYDRTNYHETFNASPEDLEWALAMEADRMVNAKVDRKDLDTEMTVVRNEMERGENNAWRMTLHRMLSAAYDWHNYGKSTIGARSDVEGVDIGELRAFYRTYYQPDNAVLVVAGQFDPAQTLAWIARDFGAIPKPARALPRLYTEEPVQDGERTVTLRRVGDQQLLGIGYHTVPGAHPDNVALGALAGVMTQAPSGRLYRALVDAKKASRVSDFTASLHDPGFVAFFAYVPLGDSLDAAKDAALATLEGVAREPVTTAEVERVKARTQKQIDRAFADPTQFGISLSESIAAGDWRLFFLNRDRVRALTTADVQRVALAWLKPANRTVALFVPDAKPDRAPPRPAVDVAAMLRDFRGDTAMEAGEAFMATPANLEARTQRFSLPNGMKVALLPKKSRGGAVKVALQVDQGDVKSLFGRAPQGVLLAQMLDRGTAHKSRQEIEDALDRLRATVEFSGRETRTTGSVATYRDQLPGTLALLSEMLRESAFPADEFAKVQREMAASVEARRKDPDAVARARLRRHGNPYPVGDVRYAPTVDEELAWIRRTTPEDVRRFHAQFLGGDAAEIAVVGDFDPVAVRAALVQAFGDWKAATPYVRVPDPLVARAPAAIIVETPDKANATLVGDVALALNDESPDYAAMVVASGILGELSGSRLFRRIREREGLSYSVAAYVGWNPVEPNSPLYVQAIYAPQNRARLAGALAEELTRAASDGFTAEEVARAREGILRRRQLARAQDATLAAQLVQQMHLGRTFAYSAKADEAIAAVTPDAASAAFRRHVPPAGFVLVYAGDFARAP